MNFRTRIDFTNRQAKQNEKTDISLSGASTFGLPYSALTTGPDLSTSAVTFTDALVESTYSGNTGTTLYNWEYPIMSINEGQLSALTPTNSGTTQNTTPTWVGYDMFTTVDGYTGYTSYSAVTYDVFVSTMIDNGGYSGLVYSYLTVYSASSVDYTGSTIWVDVSGKTRTDEIIITKGATDGYVLKSDANGLGSWQVDASGSTSLWSAGTGTDAAVLVGGGNIASGITSVAEGTGTIAGGDYSHAEGYFTTANGQSSHTEGQGTIASGNYSHAEGQSTIASGDGSHAEGDNTTASGYASHAEGQNTTASSTQAHAEGYLTTASGPVSHAEGYVTTASGNYSHAEGRVTTASGLYSHAEGHNTIASGTSSHAQGFNTIAGGDYSFAFGDGNTASGNYSFAGGFDGGVGGSLASNTVSFAFGRDAQATGYCGVALGNNTTASGVNSLAVNQQSIASASSAFASGNGTLASGNYSFAGGLDTSATTSTAMATGFNSLASGTGARAHGNGVIASGNYSFAGGTKGTHLIESGGDTTFVWMSQLNSAGDIGAQSDYSTILGGLDHNIGTGTIGNGASSIIGGRNHTIGNSDGNSAIIGGSGNTINGGLDGAVILGGAGITATTSDTVYVTNLNISGVAAGTPVGNLGYDASGKVVIGTTGGAGGTSPWTAGTGTDSAVLDGGGNTAGGNYAVAEGQENIASGDRSHAEGWQTTASAIAAHAEGYQTTATTAYAHAEGGLTYANGAGAHAEGRETVATGNYTHAEGYQTSATTAYAHAQGRSTLASGDNSHAEGKSTTASGQYSHAEGEGSLAQGDISHAEGDFTKALATGAHAEGGATTADTAYSHAEGFQTRASGQISHAEGVGTIASGSSSHAEGSSTVAGGVYTHAQNVQTETDGYASHAQGSFTYVSGYTAHVGGTSCDVIGDYSFCHGHNSSATGDNVIVFGEAIAGTATNTVYVPDLIIDGLNSTDPLATNASGLVVAGASDARLKTNIKPLVSALDKVKNLRGVSYEWTEESNMGAGIKKYGLIAQEVQDVIPDMVRARAKGDGMLTLSYTEVVPWLIEAIKELSSGSTKITNEQVILETQTIASEDNNIELNYGGNHKTSVGGGITVLDGVKDGVNAEIKTDENGNWIMNPPLVNKQYTPKSSNDDFGNKGETVWDDDYIYIKTNTGWKRSSLESF